MRRRARGQPPSLTSMIDVLFILVFASLATAAAADQAPPSPPVPAQDPEVASTPADDAAPTTAPGYADYREAGLALALQRLADRAAVILRVSAGGRLVAVETDVGSVLEVGVPLLEAVPDRDVALAYLGDSSRDLQLCAIARRYTEIDGRLLVIAPEQPLVDLSVALVGGLRRDVERCAGALAVIVEPGATP